MPLPNSIILLILSLAAGSSLYIAFQALRANRISGDPSTAIAAAGFAAMAAGLILEAVGLAAYHPPPHGGRPLAIAGLMVSRGTLLAVPLYTTAYTLMAASHYVSSRQPVILAALPLMLALYLDFNGLALIILATAVLGASSRYAEKRPTLIVFYTLLLTSHALPIAGLAYPEALPTLLQASTMLRGLAPTIIVAASMVARR